MITLDFRCEKCNTTFEIRRSIKESAPVTCPHCASDKVSRVYTSVLVLSKKEGEPLTAARGGGCSGCGATSCSSCGRIRN